MTDWVAQEDWSQVAVGDLVRVECDGGLLTGKVRYIYTHISGRPRAVDLETDSVEDIVNISTILWKVSVPAKPAVVLPDEPGTVITWRDGAYLPQIAQLDGKGRNGWRHSKDLGSAWYTPAALEKEIGGNEFTVLEPVPVTAKKVIDRVVEVWIDSGDLTAKEAISQVRGEFGVVSE